jgi:hypothetical protein
LQQIEAVRNVAYSVSLHLHLWVLLRTEDPQTEDRIYDLERAYLRGPTAVPFELHVLPLDKIGQDTLPAAETLIER